MDKEILKEQRIHGTKFFPLGIYEMNQKPGEIILECHWHEEWEFLLVTDGQAIFQVDHQQISLEKDQAIFVKHQCLHGAYPIEDGGCSYKAVVFHPRFITDHTVDPVQMEFIEPFIKGRLHFPDYIFNETESEKRIIGQLKNIFQICEAKHFGYQLQAKASLWMIWAFLLETGNFTESNFNWQHKKQTAKLKKILTFIHENYAEKISVRELTVIFAMSEGYFCRFFKKMMHMTPLEYIQRYRIRAVVNALKNNEMPIIDIAYNCGFHNLSYFNQTFKKYMNCTPSEFRHKQEVMKEKI